jgi:hypothetical protein
MMVVEGPERPPGPPAAPPPPQQVDEGENQAEEGKAQQQASNRQKSTEGWLCGDAQAAYMAELRKRIDKGGSQAFLTIPGVEKSGWIATPHHPYLGKRRGSLPDKSLFYLQQVGLWLPDLIFCENPPCSECGKNDADIFENAAHAGG